MNATVAGSVPAELSEEISTTAQTGATSFSDLVRAHCRREAARGGGDAGAAKAADAEFQAKLDDFERAEGKIAAVYWSTRNASAVAMTAGRARAQRNPLTDTETDVRLHRVTDWVTRDYDLVADALHACDLLAIRVSEILRGTSERIAMRWLYAVQEHLLGFIERADAADQKREREVVAAQRRELARVEEYYLRTASKSGRIVYVTGMIYGAAVTVAVCGVLAFLLTRHLHHWNRDVRVLLLCIGAGAIGALVSVLSRMSGGSDRFTVDFEVGRPLLRRLGVYKPFVGSVFGLALYFLLLSGLLMTQQPHGKAFYFYGIIAFLAGFSERFTGVMFGGAERLLSGDTPAEEPPPEPPAKPSG
jgi:hypothetical protein